MAGKVRAPLDGLKVVVRAQSAAAAYAARMLGVMGGKVRLIEPEGGSPLRREAPFLPSGHSEPGTVSALFAYLAVGMDSAVIDLAAPDGPARLADCLATADVFIDDTPIALRERFGIDEASLSERFPDLVHVSVLPFGDTGPKAGWRGEDLVVQHAGGEGNLLPNGLAVEMFPDRAPLKIGGHFGEMQGGLAAALGALAALWAKPAVRGQHVDISSQDANLAVGAFAIQRLGDGSIEHRVERSFRYGGVIPCADGHLEMLTLEQRQWDGLVELLDRPEWALDPELQDSLERSRRGPEINHRIREWAATRKVDDIVSAGQKLGVPLARYKTPGQILADPQERHRGLFQSVDIDRAGRVDVLVSPFHLDGEALVLRGGPPGLIPGDASTLASAKAGAE